MKNLNILSGLFISIALMGCSDMYDITDKFTEEGETNYLEKPIVELLQSGYERVQLTVNPISDSKVTKCCIYWNNRQDSLEVDFNTKTGTLQQIVNVPEGPCVFELVNKSNTAITSLATVEAVKVYGPDYQSGLKNVILLSTRVVANGVNLNFSPKENCVYTKVFYQNKEGQAKESELEGSATQLTITDYLPGSEFSYQSFFLPEINALDTVAVENKSVANFPI